MGHVNVIWQGDANSICFRSLEMASVPPCVVNVTGPELLSVRELAEKLGERLGRRPRFTGKESKTALLSNAGRCHQKFGKPRYRVHQLLDLVADWAANDRPTLDKPTRFEVRDGRF